ncbi:MAG: hypothetical protein HKN20_01020, partial [Gemmatimonadetes bacterium]|nr:hypothetical protein [Gemmatimonadota bacterium]
SGGLLAAMPGEEAAARAVDELKAQGYSSSAVIGTVGPASGHRLIFT